MGIGEDRERKLLPVGRLQCYIPVGRSYHGDFVWPADCCDSCAFFRNALWSQMDQEMAALDVRRTRRFKSSAQRQSDHLAKRPMLKLSHYPGGYRIDNGAIKFNGWPTSIRNGRRTCQENIAWMNGASRRSTASVLLPNTSGCTRVAMHTFSNSRSRQNRKSDAVKRWQVAR